MWKSVVIFFGLGLVSAGCARVQPASATLESPPAQVQADATTAPSTYPVSVRRPSAVALAFTPPVAKDFEELHLDRDERGPFTFAGYEDVVVSETWVRQDDQQRYDQWGDFGRFERRAVSTTVTVRQR